MVFVLEKVFGAMFSRAAAAKPSQRAVAPAAGTLFRSLLKKPPRRVAFAFYPLVILILISSPAGSRTSAVRCQSFETPSGKELSEYDSLAAPQ